MELISKSDFPLILLTVLYYQEPQCTANATDSTRGRTDVFLYIYQLFTCIHLFKDTLWIKIHKHKNYFVFGRGYLHPNKPRSARMLAKLWYGYDIISINWWIDFTTRVQIMKWKMYRPLSFFSARYNNGSCRQKIGLYTVKTSQFEVDIESDF